MNLTKEWFREHGACSPGYNWVLHRKNEDALETMQALLSISRIDWADWVLARLLEKEDQVRVTLFILEEILPTFIKRNPNAEHGLLFDSQDHIKKFLDPEENTRENRFISRTMAMDLTCDHFRGDPDDLYDFMVYALGVTYADTIDLRHSCTSYLMDKAFSMGGKEFHRKMFEYSIKLADLD